MQIYNKKDGLYIQAWEYTDNKELYIDKYQERSKNTNYYSKEVYKLRKSWVESRVDITKSFDHGAGIKPYYNQIPENNKPLGMYDPYVEPYNIFNRNDWLNSETLLLFDTIEHMYDPQSFLNIIPQNQLIMSLPCVPIKYFYHLDQIKDWKHYKPAEHLLYSNEEGIIDILEDCGWTIIDSGEFEAPIRTDILCIYAKRN